MLHPLIKRHSLQFIRTFHSTNVKFSAQSIIKRKSLNDIRQLYNSNTKISVLTAHDYISGKIANDSDVDMILVGDSLAMVALGYEDTNEIPFDEFLYHCRAVSRGTTKSFLIADLPFGSYESSISKAIESSVQLISKGRANAIKLEGGKEIAPTIKSLTQVGIPVMAHIGLTPQRSNSLGGFKVQGNTGDSAFDIYQDALEVQKAGAFAVVLEAIPAKIGKFITENLSIPTIGIGAGPDTSGQVLVQADLLNLTNSEINPKFVKKYLNGYKLSIDAIGEYINDVKSQKFPELGIHTYKIKDDHYENFIKKVDELKNKK
ncbi:3-methyl-2-oxobutanoatehydroxymethyltransferase [Wickerhamomyces ciferrii]|uniref:3-methyl-2-oxobutanoate hydroxymethyltransferase n=1 Tax=Wickerhamomyces ciferrii (strain ATCC 14091 / BCRC 22168 / CBS 111 / JCM 3599 / NBRC 0793 / NRRL Y-1031 F-60-10) TaxID=1206466 RepID=K0KXD0_WICCF|nr:3-methyl-2-oxobutanoatehydroxymethyltransferase [Wickerhamomyces ciferrii]CCH46692.1 3-methyl-2-oxobutanoatehydroxymethyltransferase [Wickerhamomyces ciferrii]